VLDGFFILLVIAVVGVVFGVPLVALVSARKAARLAQRNEDSLQQLKQQVRALENRLEELGGVPARVQILGQAARPTELRSAPWQGTGTAAPEQVKLTTPAADAARAPEPKAQISPDVARPVPTAPPAPGRAVNLGAEPGPMPAVPPVATEPVLPTGESSSTRLPPPLFESLGPSPHEVAKRVLSLEEMLGANWLNKLGVVILVIGVALFLAYEMRELGPVGKVLVGFLVSGALLGAGIFYERRERYRLLARAGLGGGWALVFFTAYAMYHVPAARILHSQALDLSLLLIVAAAMVAHTLRYNSQVVTGLALLLGYVTVTISHDNVYSLSAGAILALGLVAIVRRREWFELEIFGILGSYLNHYYWLRPIIEPMGNHHRAFPEFFASAALLVFYWLIFRLSYLWRRPANAARESISTLAGLLNTFLLLGVMKYQSVHPEWAFRFLLLLGAVEFTLGQLPIARRRRAAFVTLSVVGTALLIVALPFKYSGATLPILWLAEAETLFLAGVFLQEIVFCRLGLAASLLVAFQMDRLALHQIYDAEWKGFQPGDLLRGTIVFVAAVLIFYADAHWLGRRHALLRESRWEALSLRVLSYAGGATAFIGIWWLAPEAWAAVGFSALALVLVVLASRGAIHEFHWQAVTVASLAFLRVLFVNLGEEAIHRHLGTRLLTVGLTAALLYAAARWVGVRQMPAARSVPAGFTWAASILVGALAWYELAPSGVAVAWTLEGLALFEFGRTRGLAYLRIQAYLALAASFLRLFYINFNAAGVPGDVSPRFYTTVPVALAFFYAYWVLETSTDVRLDWDHRLKARQVLCFLGTLTIAGLARFELDADWVIAAWAALVIALVAIAWRFERRIFLHQASLLGMAILARGVFHNFYERSYFPAPFWQSRGLTVGVAVALLFATLPFAFQLVRAPASDAASHPNALRRIGRAFDDHPDQVYFFIPFLLLTILLALEMRKGMVTVAWGMEAVAVFLFALIVGRRSYRISGLALLLLCVAKIVVLDVWGLQPRDRYLTFIVLGVALLGVSFLYTRYRAAIRQYL